MYVFWSIENQREKGNSTHALNTVMPYGVKSASRFTSTLNSVRHNCCHLANATMHAFWSIAIPCRELLYSCSCSKQAWWHCATATIPLLFNNSKWLLSGNTTITNCRQTHGFVWKSHTACVMIMCCRKIDASWTVATQSACLPILCHSILVLVRIPWKITRLPSQHSMLGHYRSASETPAFRWRATTTTKNCQIWVGPPLTKLSGSAYGFACLYSAPQSDINAGFSIYSDLLVCKEARYLVC